MFALSIENATSLSLLLNSMMRLQIVLTLISAALALGAPQFTLYVSPSGNDRWSGLLPAPNASKSDGPVATLTRARDAMREAKARGSLVAGGTVEIRAGTYVLNEPLVFTAEDSGSPGAPTIWRSYGNEKVRVTGSRRIGNFLPVHDPEVLLRLSSAARKRVLVSDLRAQGLTDFGEIVSRGGPPVELFFDGKRMTPARFPNTGWLRIADVPQSGDSLYNRGLDREKRFKNVPVGRHYGRIAYSGERPSRWKPSPDIYLHGYWTWDWSDSYQRVASVDTLRREITLLTPHHHYGYTTDQRYYVLNVLEELDAPGEWYLDRRRGLLFFWPPASDDITAADALLTLLDRPLVSVMSSAGLRFEGLEFAFSRGAGVEIAGSHDVSLEKCLIHSLGRDAVLIDGGARNRVSSCEIRDIGLGGIILKGGDRKTLQPSGHEALNNHIHHWSTWLRTGQYAVILDGVGHRMAHHLIHDSPFEGVYIKGNDHIIEYNEFHSLMKESGDAGAIHTGRDWTWQGNVIRYNYFHDLQGPGLHGVMAVYLDDFSCGFTVYGNLFYRAGRAAFLGGGRDNVVENNMFVECRPSVHLDARGLGWASYYYDGTNTELARKMEEVRYDQPPYSTRYPGLLRMYDGQSAVPKYNRIERNISYGGRWMDVYDFQSFDFSVVTVKSNLIGDSVVLRRRKDGEKGWDPYYLNIDLQEGYEALGQEDPRTRSLFSGNLLTRGNPGVRAPEKGDFSVAPSTVEKISFRPIPLEKIGLRKGARKRIPRP